MKLIILFCLLFLFHSVSNSQIKFQIEETGLTFVYGDTKFNNAYSSALRYSQVPDYHTPKTVCMVDALPTVTVVLHKRINLVGDCGFEFHTIRNDIKRDVYIATGHERLYKKKFTNLLFKVGTGCELILLGTRKTILNFNLQTIFTYEGVLINRTKKITVFGPFGDQFLLTDYARKNYRLGFDLTPVIRANITERVGLKISAGYSFGLNNSNKRILRDDSNAYEPWELFNRKESTFIFSAGVYYNLSKTNRRSFKNWKFSELTNKMFYNQ